MKPRQDVKNEIVFRSKAECVAYLFPEILSQNNSDKLAADEKGTGYIPEMMQNMSGKPVRRSHTAHKK